MRDRMSERGVTSEEIQWALEAPDISHPGRQGATVSRRKTPEGNELCVAWIMKGSAHVIKTAYWSGEEDEQ
ncbi:DUF4258 domain-containing protein [Rhodococcus pyridinivorans]